MSRIAGTRVLPEHLKAVVTGHVLEIGVLVAELLVEKNADKLLVLVLEMHDKLHKPELRGSRGILAIKADIKRLAKSGDLFS